MVGVHPVEGHPEARSKEAAVAVKHCCGNVAYIFLRMFYDMQHLISGSFMSDSKVGTLKKAAIVAAGVYAGYKLGKLKSKFGKRKKHPSFDFDFDDWNDWREADGFLCKNSTDCQWVDRGMFCQIYEGGMAFKPSVRYS
jgi:hypothetical protein